MRKKKLLKNTRSSSFNYPYSFAKKKLFFIRTIILGNQYPTQFQTIFQQKKKRLKSTHFLFSLLSHFVQTNSFVKGYEKIFALGFILSFFLHLFSPIFLFSSRYLFFKIFNNCCNFELCILDFFFSFCFSCTHYSSPLRVSTEHIAYIMTQIHLLGVRSDRIRW